MTHVMTPAEQRKIDLIKKLNKQEVEEWNSHPLVTSATRMDESDFLSYYIVRDLEELYKLRALPEYEQLLRKL